MHGSREQAPFLLSVALPLLTSTRPLLSNVPTDSKKRKAEDEVETPVPANAKHIIKQIEVRPNTLPCVWYDLV